MISNVVVVVVGATMMAQISSAFVVPQQQQQQRCLVSSRSGCPSALFLSSETPTEEGEKPTEEASDEIPLDVVEKFGRGARKVKRAKRKGNPIPSTKVEEDEGSLMGLKGGDLGPEDVFYEGPPAITETFFPTLSILTVVGIIPAIAAWSRQAFVRYKFTNRRIRVQSGIGGKDEVEVVYNDIVELRTAQRLFGDGDLVATLRDGAKLEMRNVPNFPQTVEFIVAQLPEKVAELYRSKGDVTRG